MRCIRTAGTVGWRQEVVMFCMFGLSGKMPTNHPRNCTHPEIPSNIDDNIHFCTRGQLGSGAKPDNLRNMWRLWSSCKLSPHELPARQHLSSHTSILRVLHKLPTAREAESVKRVRTSVPNPYMSTFLKSLFFLG